MTVSRREFLGAAAIGATGAAIASVTGCSGPSTNATEDKGSKGSQQTGSPQWLGEPPVIDQGALAEELDCEILVVGAGTAGHFAAMSAAESGADVLVIEKGDEGGFGIRYNVGGVNTELQQSAGIEIDRTAITEDFSRHANNYNNQDLVHMWYDESGAILDKYVAILKDAGMFPHLVNNKKHEEAIWHEWTTAIECLDTEDMKVWMPVESYVTERGGRFRFHTSLVELIKDETGKVVGAYAEDEGGNAIKVNASKGVIVCTGGYAANLDMMKALQPQTCELYSYVAAPPSNVGDGIKACLWAGASQDPNHSACLFERTQVPPDRVGGVDSLDVGKAATWCAQPWLSVDLNGKRFCNESSPYDYRLHAISQRPGKTYVTLLDSNYVEHIKKYDTFGCSRNVVKNSIPQWDGTQTIYTEDKIASLGDKLNDPESYVQKADTWEELAEKLGIPADNLVATVNRYNEMCEKGVDEDFGKEAYRLVPYTTPPYYGVRTTGRLLCTFDGIRVDTTLRALDADGNAIEGLYCAGNDSGCYFEFSYPDLAPGACGGRAATFGYLAVKHALGEYEYQVKQ